MTHHATPQSNTPAISHAVLVYCRPGFENEAAAELQQQAINIGVFGYCKAKPESGFVVFVPHEGGAELEKRLRFDRLIFARQLVFRATLVDSLPVTDRVTPLAAIGFPMARKFSAVLCETADTNEAKELSSFCRSFEKPFLHALKADGRFAPDEAQAARLHLFFLSSSAAWVGISRPGNSSPWAMGISRLRLPRGAPSRATLKLAEALQLFLEPGERDEALAEGRTAVDLGAAPGGWTWQLVRHGIHVTAVDNGNMAEELMQTGLVEHLREDGFRYRPKRPVEWLVCDMIEKPSRIAAMVAQWASNNLFHRAVFNLKLPMKKRFDEVENCRDLIAEALGERKYQLRFRQLYHDREEVTGYLRLDAR